MSVRGKEFVLLEELLGHTDRVWNLEWSPSGVALASCSGDKSVRLWRRESGEGLFVCTQTLEGLHQRTVRACSWSPDGQCLATASFDATVGVWERQGSFFMHVAVLEGHESEVKGIAWSPTGTLIATCSRDKTVWIWSVEPGHEYDPADIKYGHTQDVKSVKWHPSGEVLVSTSYDDSIKLWVETDDEWVCHQTLAGPGIGHSSSVWCVAFSPDGTKMVSCSQDKTLRIWECLFARGFREPKWQLLSVVSGFHDQPILSVDWSKQDLICTGCSDNGIRIFRQTNQTACTEPSAVPRVDLVAHKANAHPTDVNCVRWHPTEPGLLASAGDDQCIRLWRISPQLFDIQ